MRRKIRIFQADDNDSLPVVNKFELVVKSLLDFFNIDTEQFFQDISYADEKITKFNNKAAISYLNSLITYDTSSKDVNKPNDNFEEVKKHMLKTHYDIYIIDLSWKNHKSDSGLELVRIAAAKTNPENIYIYSHHADVFLDLVSTGAIDSNVSKTISTAKMAQNFDEYLPVSFLKTREQIILGLPQIQVSKIKNAIEKKHFKFFENSIKVKSESIDFRYLFPEVRKISTKTISGEINSLLPNTNLESMFLSSSKFKKMMPYVLKYIEIGTERLFDKIDFIAINIFFRILNTLRYEDYLIEEYTLDSKFRAIPSASVNEKKLFTTNEWNNFYMRLAMRRVFILWNENFHKLNELNEQIGLNNGKKKFDKISHLVFHGNSFEQKSSTNHVKEMVTVKLGFQSKNGSLIYEGEKSFDDEKRFIKKYPFHTIKNLYNFISSILNQSYINKKYAYLNYSPCFDLWDLKEYLHNQEELEKDFISEVTSDIDEFEDINDSVKKILFDKRITSITKLLE